MFQSFDDPGQDEFIKIQPSPLQIEASGPANKRLRTDTLMKAASEQLAEEFGIEEKPAAIVAKSESNMAYEELSLNGRNRQRVINDEEEEDELEKAHTRKVKAEVKTELKGDFDEEN